MMLNLFIGFLLCGLLAIYAIRTALTVTGKRTIGPYIRFLGASVMVWVLFNIHGWASNKLIPSFTEKGIVGATDVVLTGQTERPATIEDIPIPEGRIIPKFLRVDSDFDFLAMIVLCMAIGRGGLDASGGMTGPIHRLSGGKLTFFALLFWAVASINHCGYMVEWCAYLDKWWEKDPFPPMVIYLAMLFAIHHSTYAMSQLAAIPPNPPHQTTT